MSTTKIFLFLLVCFSFGCNSDPVSSGCEQEIDQGDFPLSEEAKAVFGYSGTSNIPFYNMDKTDTINLIINDPAKLESTTRWWDAEVDCGEYLDGITLEWVPTPNKYFYKVEDKYTVVSVEGVINIDYLFITTSVFEEGDGHEKLNESLFMFKSTLKLDRREHTLLPTPPLSLPLFGAQEDEDEKEYIFHPSIILHGKEYLNVYETTKINSIYAPIYFTLEEGVIAIEEETDGQLGTNILFTID